MEIRIKITLIPLQDNTHYNKVNNYSQSKIMNKLSTLIHHFEQGLNEKEKDYMTNLPGKLTTFMDLTKSTNVKP